MIEWNVKNRTSPRVPHPFVAQMPHRPVPQCGALPGPARKCSRYKKSTTLLRLPPYGQIEESEDD